MAQVPALIVSTAAGIVVTRAASEANLGFEITRQVLISPKAVGTAAGTYFLVASIDSTNAITESIEGNNDLLGDVPLTLS